MRSVLYTTAAIAIVATLAAPRASAVNGASTIATIAGNGTAGFAGDGGRATAALLKAPVAVATDAHGNVYIADRDNNRVREVSGGTITTIAGTGTAGFSGDGGPATAAELNSPRGVAVDAQGNVYIADTNNQRIRRISGGTITTIAGTGTAGYSGENRLATASELNFPSGVAVDAQGDIFIADTQNERVRQIINGSLITIAGSTLAGFSGDDGPATTAQLDLPTALAFDADGNLYIADSGNRRIREVIDRDPVVGTMTTFAGNGQLGDSGDLGPATGAEFEDPVGVAVDGRGDVYIADDSNGTVREIVDGTINTIASRQPSAPAGDGGPAINSSLSSPTGVTMDAHGDLYIADRGANTIRKILDAPPTPLFIVNPPGGTPPLQAAFDASPSYDDDGSIVSYAWQFGDGATANGKRVAHGYARAGNYTATLTVTDDAGVASTATRIIGVMGSALPPAATPSSPAGVTLAPTSPPRLSVHLAGGQRLLAQPGLRLTAMCDTACSLTVTGIITISGVSRSLSFKATRAALAATHVTTLTLRLSTAARRRLARLLGPGRHARATIRVRAINAAGLAALARNSVDVRR